MHFVNLMKAPDMPEASRISVYGRIEIKTVPVSLFVTFDTFGTSHCFSQ
jgi:hypothetical protein